MLSHHRLQLVFPAPPPLENGERSILQEVDVYRHSLENDGKRLEAQSPPRNDDFNEVDGSLLDLAESGQLLDEGRV